MKDSSKRKTWFVPKLYGRGFVPVSLEGVVCVVCILGIILLSAYSHSIIVTATEPSTKEFAGFFVDLFLIIFSSSWFMEKYTDGKLAWRWGNK